MLIGVMQAVLSADTSAWDSGLAKADTSLGKLRTSTVNQTEQINKAMNNMGNLSGLQGQIGNLTGQVGGMWSKMSGVISGAVGALGTPIGAVIGAAAAGAAATVGFGVALHSMASRGAEAIMSMRHLAQEIGITMEAMSRLGNFGGDSLAHSLIHMQRGIEDASESSNRALSRIGLNPISLHGLDADQQLRLIADGFARLQNQGERASVAMALFGRGGIGMIEDLRRGAAGLDAAAARAERFGQVVTDAQADAIKRANREWSGLGSALDGIGKQAAAMFAPMWEAMGKAGSAFGEYLVSLFRNAQPYIEEFGSAFASAFAPAWEAIKTIGLTLGEMFRAAIPLIGQLWEMVVEVGRAFMSITFGGTFASIGDTTSVILSAFRAIVPWVKIFFEVLTAAWRMIGDIAVALWNGVYSTFSAIGDLIATVFDATGIASWLDSVLGSVRSFKDLFITGLAVLAVAMKDIGRVWGIIVDTIKKKWLEFIRDLLNSMPTWLKNRLGDMLPSLNVAQINRDIDNISRRLTLNMGNFQRDVQGLIAQWNQELEGGLRGLRGLNVWVPRVMQNVFNDGLTRAVTGHEATTRNSDRAFTLLNGSSGTQEYYQRATLENARLGNELLRDVRAELRGAPAIRRARL